MQARDIPFEMEQAGSLTKATALTQALNTLRDDSGNIYTSQSPSLTTYSKFLAPVRAVLLQIAHHSYHGCQIASITNC